MLDDEKLSHVADWLLAPPLILVLASVANWVGRRRHGRGACSVIKRVADAVWAEDDGVLEEPEL